MSKTHSKRRSKSQRSIKDSAQNVPAPRDKSLWQHLCSRTGLLTALIVVVCAAVVATHWPALSAQALFFDDEEYLTENPLVQDPSWASAGRFLTEVLEPSTVGGYYQPLTMISLMLDYAMGGRPNKLGPFHRTSLALHALNTALIIVLLYQLFGQVWIAAGMGLLFGLHPMTTETIPWVGERKTLLAAFFSLWSLVLYVRYANRRNWKPYIGCFVMYILAVMSKPTSLPLPMLMLLMDYWPLNRLKAREVFEKLPFFALAAVMAIITYQSQSRTADAALAGGYGAERIWLVLCHNIIFYLRNIFWPANLSSYYIFPEPLGLSHPMVLAGVIGTLILLPLLVVSLRWTRALITGWLFFFVAISPTMGVVRFTNVIASDKFAYIPSVGLLMVLTSFLAWLCRTGSFGGRLKARRAVLVIIVLTLAGAEAAATRRYLLPWRSTVSLYKHFLAMTPNVASMHYNLALAFDSQGKPDEAITHYRRTLQLNPKHAKAHNNLGNMLAHQDKLDEALTHYRQALRINPYYAPAYHNTGWVLELQYRFDEAISYYRRALTIAPDHADGYNCIAWILATRADSSAEQLNEAVRMAERASELTGHQDAEVLDTLAVAYAAVGQFDRAVATAKKALELASTTQTEELAAHIRKRLELYRQSKPYKQYERTPDTTGP